MVFPAARKVWPSLKPGAPRSPLNHMESIGARQIQDSINAQLQKSS